jgi:tetratricopeptide (TPR) repeat protein
MKVRFGRWDEILKAEPPAADLPHARAMWHYARGRALAARGDVAGAEAQLALVRAVATDPAVVPLRLEFNTSGDVLAIAADVLAGHIAAARADFDAAAARLREAAAREAALTYGEPPDWSVPVNQELGAVLLAAGRAQEAETAFRKDLERFPDNGWSLHGLAQALRLQQRDADAAIVLERFRRTWEGADPSLAAAN